MESINSNSNSVIIQRPVGGPDSLESVELFMHQLLRQGPHSPLSDLSLHHMATGSRRIRAKLVLGAAKILNYSEQEVVPWAAACEILQNAALIHDDIQDGDEYRRGQKTLWSEFGVPDAINAGDFLFMLPFEAVNSLQTEEAIKWALSQEMARQASLVVRGQALESRLVDLVGSPELSSEYQRVVQLKSMPLFRLPIWGVMRLAGHPGQSIQLVAELFANLGRIFQWCDDLADFHGLKRGRSRGNDLREGKVSILMLSYLEDHRNEAEEIRIFFKTPRVMVDEQTVSDWLWKFESSGVDARVKESMLSLREQCLRQAELLDQGIWRDMFNEISDLVLRPILNDSRNLS